VTFKFPKFIIIGSTKFHITYDIKRSDAEFRYPENRKKAYINFGTSELRVNPIGFLNLIIHELKEILDVELGNRIFCRSTGSYKFMYEYSGHDAMCSMLAGLLTQFIK